MNSKTILENGEYIKDAALNGVNGEAVESTLEDIINKSDELGKTPKQLKETVETIIDMKSTVSENVDENYLSSVVRNNSNKIESAVNEGITPQEVSTSLINSTENIKNKKDKKHLKFLVKLVSKMKRKELSLKNKKTNSMGGRQKIKTNY